MIKLFINDGNIGQFHKREANGKTYLDFSVATKRWNGKENVTDWINCKIFGKKAEGKLAEMLTKGTRVSVIGTLQTRKPEKVTYFDCFVEEISVFSNKPKQQESSYSEPQATTLKPLSDDDIPF